MWVLSKVEYNILSLHAVQVRERDFDQALLSAGIQRSNKNVVSVRAAALETATSANADAIAEVEAQVGWVV